MKAYIKEDTVKSEALWLVIERGNTKAKLDGIMGVSRDEDSHGNVAFAFLKDEIEEIKKACEEYLKHENT